MRCRQDTYGGTVCGKEGCSEVLVTAAGEITPLCDEHLLWTRVFAPGDAIVAPSPEQLAEVTAREVMES